jgi:hypothetical protein
MPGQEGFKYVYAVTHIDDFFRKMQDTGRPDKLTQTYAIKNWNLPNNGQYSAVIELLKSMKFLDSEGVPQELYSQFQHPRLAGKAVGHGIKNAYPSLFRVHPRANEMDRDEITGFIRQNTGADKTIVRRTCATFEKLCTYADFTDGAEPLKEEPKGKQIKVTENTPPPTSLPIPITMNIQIVIPNDATEEQYDKIFSSLKKFITPQQQDEEQS